MQQDTAHSQNDPFVNAFEDGAVFVYPTEAVMGIGCNPDNEDAVKQILAIKNRPVEKGVILIASTYSQLLPYVNDNAIAMDRRTAIFSSWPGPVTWLLPKSTRAPDWITGGQPKIAVRVTDHPVVKALCERVGKPLVSTSANPSGAAPAKSKEEAQHYFGDSVLYVDGDVGRHGKPSTIRDCDTGEIIRE